jgi:hypothetical protein
VALNKRKNLLFVVCFVIVIKIINYSNHRVINNIEILITTNAISYSSPSIEAICSLERFTI